MGSMSRRRWVHIIDNQDKQLLATSYAYESLADELVFILGPVITTAIVAAIDPAAGLILGIVFLLVGVPLVASHKKSDPGVELHEGEEKQSSVMRNRSLQAIAIPMTIVGGCFSAVNICVVALTTEQDQKAVSGLLLGNWAIGGATSALINGAIRWKISHGRRFIGYLLGMALFSLTFPFMENLYLLGVVLFLQGTCIAPLLPNGLPIVTHSVTPSQMTQAITLATAGIPLRRQGGLHLHRSALQHRGAGLEIQQRLCGRQRWRAAQQVVVVHGKATASCKETAETGYRRSDLHH
jgi:hypothetical protein